MASTQPTLAAALSVSVSSPVRRRATTSRVRTLAALLLSSSILAGSFLSISPVRADDQLPSHWSISGAFLAGMSAKAHGDMKTAAQLLPVALAASPGDPGLIQATLYAQISNGQVDDAIKLAKQLATSQPAAVAAAPLVTVVLAQDAIKKGQYDKALDFARKLPDQQIGKYAGPMMRAWLIAGSKKQIEPALKELQPLESRSEERRVGKEC